MPAAADKMYTVIVKKVLVSYATVYVRAKDRAEATADALAQCNQQPGPDFEEPSQHGSLEVIEVVEG